MKILKQIMIIGTVTFAGEMCNLLLPLPVPASVYGMLLLFLCLQTGVIKLYQIEETADFLMTIMPVMFVAPCVSLMDSIAGVKDSIPALAFICLFTTVTTMSVTGVTAQFIIRIRTGTGVRRSILGKCTDNMSEEKRYGEEKHESE